METLGIDCLTGAFHLLGATDLVQIFRVVLLASAATASLPLVSALSAQELWVHGGATFATVSQGDSEFHDEGGRTGFSLGLGLTLPVSNALAVQLDGAFTQKGDAGGVEGANAMIGVNYVEFSPVLKASALESTGALAHIFAGPSVAFRVSCDVEGAFAGGSLSDTCDAIDLDVATIDFGLMAGIGVESPVSETLSLAVDVLYSHGLASLIEDAEQKNRAFIVRVGVGFSRS